MTQRPTTDLFNFSEALCARVSHIERNYSDEDLKSLFVNGLIQSIKPNAYSY